MKNLINNKLKGKNDIQDIKQKKELIQNEILLDIEQYKIKNEFSNEDISNISDICENNSFLDYEFGSVNNIAIKDYEDKLKNYGINLGVDFISESYFYAYKFFNDYKYSDDYNYYNIISNDEIEERIVEDKNFFHNYYNKTDIILNKSDVGRLNMIFYQIINNNEILLNDISRIIGIRSKRQIYPKKKKNINSNINCKMNEKVSILNKLFIKCPSKLFIRYINAHNKFKYYSEFIIKENRYYIPEKLLFYNYYNDYDLIKPILSEQNNKFKENEQEENSDNNTQNNEEEEDT